MPSSTAISTLIAASAATGAGFINAVAGGGTLVSFPALTAIGIAPVTANATNTVALCPGYVGGTYSQRRDLDGLATAVRSDVAVAAVGGLAGALLLVSTSNQTFRSAVPYLILTSCLLLLVQSRLRSWTEARDRLNESRRRALELAGVLVAAVYGGYFGAGLGIMLLAVLGLFSPLPLNRLNAVKQILAASINVLAASLLMASGNIDWTLVAAMAPASLAGGHLGGQVASRLNPQRFRSGVAVGGVIVALIYLLR